MPPGVGYDNKYFRNQSGDFVDSAGTVIADPATRLSISQSIGGELNNLPLYQQSPTSLPSTPVDPTAPPTPTSQPDLPTPTAGEVGTNYVTSVSQDLEAKRKTLEDRYKSELDTITKQKDESEKRIAELEKQQAATLEDDVQPLLQPFRDTLETSERQRLKVEENYFANQGLVEELSTLLNQGNAAIKAAQAQYQSIPRVIGQARINQVISDVAARAGVIEAVLAARNGQIAQAYNLIDRSVEATVADRNDRLTYFNTLLDFYDNQKDDEGNKLIKLEAREEEFLDAEIGLLESDMENAQATADYVKELMVSPDSAATMAEAGVTLNDSVETINKKLADYTIRKQREEQHKQNKAELEAAGLSTPFVNRGGEIQRSSDGYAFESDTEFKKLTGLTLAEAGSRGMISNFVSAERQAFEYERSVTERQLAMDEAAFDLDYQKFISEDSGRDDEAERRTENALSQADVVIGKVDEALGQISSGNTGLNGGLMKNIPGTSAYNLNRTIDTIKANVGFQALQAMREASPTGGALGQVAVQELQMLQATLASLDIGQSADQLKANLNQVKTSFDKLKDTLRQSEDIDLSDPDPLDLGFDKAGKPQASTPYLNTLGNITAYGSPLWKYGLDVDLKKGDPVRSPVSGTIIASEYEKGFGNTVKIQDSTGRVWRLSHLDKRIAAGKTVKAGQVIGLGGNTGSVIPMGGGDGSHLDITVYQHGKPLAAKQVKSLLDRVRV